jgi:hypothetical protein
MVASEEGRGMKPYRSYVWAVLIVGALLVTLLGALDVVVRRAEEIGPDDHGPWASHVAAVDRAVARRDASEAVTAWFDAYYAALGARGWQGYADVADAQVRIGSTFGHTRAAQVPVRQLYLDTLLRARERQSLEGVLRAAKGFADLGDRHVARRALGIAERLARTDEARARVRENAARVYSVMAIAD